MLILAYLMYIYQDIVHWTKFLKDLVIPWVYIYVIHHCIVDLEIFIDFHGLCEPWTPKYYSQHWQFCTCISCETVSSSILTSNSWQMCDYISITIVLYRKISLCCRLCCYECTARVTMPTATNKRYFFRYNMVLRWWFYRANLIAHSDAVCVTCSTWYGFLRDLQWKLHAAERLPHWLPYICMSKAYDKTFYSVSDKSSVFTATVRAYSILWFYFSRE